MIRIWLGDLAKYNDGDLVGEWLDLPMCEDELKTKFDLYTHNGQGDFFLADWEAPFNCVSEYSNPIALNELAEKLERLSEYDLKRVAYLVDDENLTVDDALEKFEDVSFYDGMSLKEVAEEMIEEGLFSQDFLLNYVDSEAIGRDLGFDGYTKTSEGVFHYCG